MGATELSSPPSLAGLYARAVAMPLVPGGGEELPDRELRLAGMPLERDRVAEYARVCGFPLRDTVPATYPHILAFPLQLKLMTARDFPFSVLGMVHIANRIEVLGAIPLGEGISLTVRTEDLRPHRRGKQFDMVTNGEIGAREVWRSRSTYLRRGGGGDEATPGPEIGPPDDAELATTAVWKIPGDTGRRYAEVSGDRNPIHLHPLTARAFGQPSMIAHGMWTKARCLAAFESRLPATYRVAAAFKAPLRIPGKAELRSAPDDGGFVFELTDPAGERRHLGGEIASLAG